MSYESFAHEGELDGLAWELRAQSLAPAFRTPSRVLRRVASTQMAVQPAELYTGRVGARTFERAPGHDARLWGSRHALTWGVWCYHSEAARGLGDRTTVMEIAQREPIEGWRVAL
jgi:hypothetical protein